MKRQSEVGKIRAARYQGRLEALVEEKLQLQREIDTARNEVQTDIDQEEWGQAEQRASDLKSLGRTGENAAAELLDHIQVARAKSTTQRHRMDEIEVALDKALARGDLPEARREQERLTGLGKQGQDRASQWESRIAQTDLALNKGAQGKQVEDLLTDFELRLANHQWEQAQNLIDQVHEFGSTGEQVSRRMLKRLKVYQTVSSSEPPLNDKLASSTLQGPVPTGRRVSLTTWGWAVLGLAGIVALIVGLIWNSNE